jgi:hypothetical protein
MPRFIIEARDTTYKRIGPVENYTNFEAIIRHNAVGTWSLTIPGSAPEIANLQPGNGIIVRIEGQDGIAFSGPISKISHNWGESDQGAGSVTVSGLTDDQLLFERVTYPVPANDLDGQTSDRTILVSNAGTLMELLVLENCGMDARPERQYPQLDVGNGSQIGGPSTVSTRFDVLGEVLQELANSNAVGFNVRQTDDDRLLFDMFIPQDKSNLVFGREFGNLQAYSYDIEAPTATRAIFACQGEGRDRYLEDAEFNPYLAETLDDRSERIIYTSGASDGSDPDCYRGTFTIMLNADADLRFTGTGVRVYGQASMDPWINNFAIVDGGDAVEIEEPTEPPGTPRVLLFEVSNLLYGEHTLKIATVSGLFLDYVEILDERTIADWRRNSERFYDRRDIPVAWNTAHTSLIDPSNVVDGVPQDADPAVYRPLLDQATLEAWDENGPKASLSLSPIDTVAVKYGRDYRVGDIVTVDVNGLLFSEVLREVRLSDGDDGPRITPTIGDSQASSTPNLYRTVRQLWTKVRRLEAR